MAPANVDIEAIVREVVRRLRALDAKGVGSLFREQTNGDAEASNAKKTPDPVGAASLELSDHVITLSTLNKRLDGVQRVTVKPRAIVTPAVIDELRDRNIELIRCGNIGKSENNGQAARSTTSPVVVSLDGRTDTAALTRLLNGVEVINGANQSNKQALEIIASRITQGDLAVLLTSTPSAVVVSANRNTNIRAAVGFNFPAVRRAVDEAGANLLAIDPTGKSNAQISAMIHEFLQRP